MSQIVKTIIVALSSCLLLPPASAAELFVSGSGDDSNSGLSSDQALGSITEAVTRLRERGEGGRVLVLPGVYTSASERFPIALPPGVSVIGTDPEDRVVIRGVWYDWDQVYLEDLQYAPLFLVEEATREEGCFLNNLVLTGGTGLLYDPHGHDPMRDFDHPITRGGAIASIGGRIAIQNCEIEENVGFDGGGAVAAYVGAEVTLENCRIHHNVIGGIYAGSGTALLAYIDSTLILKDCHLYHNCGWDLGQPIFRDYPGGGLGRGAELGAICLYNNCQLEMSRSLMERNTNTALHMRGSKGVIRDSRIVMNSSFEGRPGAIETHESHLEMDHVEVSRNYGSPAMILGSAIFTNVTVVDNISCFCFSTGRPVVFGLQVACDGPSFTAVNSIFWQSIPYRAPYSDPTLWLDVISAGPAFADIRWSCIGGGYPGEGNISEDPRFVDPENADFHLRPDSPCIDAGSPFGMADPDRTRPDLGAYSVPQDDQDLFIRGDANRDGTVDLADGVTILALLFLGSQPVSVRACDANDDDRTDLADAIYVLNYLFAGGPQPPPPFPFAGIET